MENNKPSVLVIIPTYNRDEMLSEAIESVLQQNYTEVMILVVDDGSEDGTLDLCQKYTKYGNINYIFKNNGGCASARNLGLQNIEESTQYVCFLDSDDRQLPGFLHKAITLLETHPYIDFCYSDCILYDAKIDRQYLQRVAAAGRPERFAIEHFLSNEAKSGSILYRTKVVRHLRFREDLRYNEDSEFLQRVAIEYRGEYLPDPGSWVRWHSGSKSQNFLEINRAILRSCSDIIVSYPRFYTSYKAVVDKRMKSLQQALFASLTLTGHWTEAETFAQTRLEKIFAANRINIYYRLRKIMRLFIRHFKAAMF